MLSPSMSAANLARRTGPEKRSDPEVLVPNLNSDVQWMDAALLHFFLERSFFENSISSLECVHNAC